jgi:acyl-CoA thioesterase
MSPPWGRWRPSGTGGVVVPLGPEMCGAADVLFGGWSMGILCEAAHRATGWPVRDLSVSFVRPVRAAVDLVVLTETLTAGGSLAQVRLTASTEDGIVLAGTAVTGLAEDSVTTALRPPEVPPPQDCPPREYAGGPGAGTAVLLDVRIADERIGAGAHSAVALWARLRCSVADQIRLAVVSDHVPYLVRRSVRGLAAISTVAATFRAVSTPVDDWVLLDISLDALGDRLAVGRTAIWSAGRLVATAEQTARLHRRRR